ncbi:MAG: DUF885 domain-containing protein [Pseudomonadota bacterium]
MRLPIFAAALLLTACGQSEAPTETVTAARPSAEETAAETARLNDWFEVKFEEQMQQSPLLMTFRGRKDRYTEVDDLSIEAADEQLEMARQAVAELETEFDYNKLTPEAKISYDIWKYQYEQAEAGVEFRRNNYVFEQMSSIHTLLVNFLINFHRVDEVADYDAYVARISGISRGIDQLLVQAKANAEAGVRPPRFAYEEVLKQSEALLTGAPFTEEGDAPLWSDAQRKLDALLDAEKIDAETKTRLLVETRNALADEFEPAYQRLIDFVAAELPKTAEIATGVGALPNGKAYYNYMLASSTTTDMTAEEVHQLGLDEVARIRKEMATLKDNVGFDGDLSEFFTFIREDEQFYFPNTDEGRQAYIDEAEAKLAFINEKLPDYFGLLPKADLVVKRVEPFREQDGAAQHYYPGTPDGSRPGIYYAHLSDMTAMPINQLEVIAYHEGNPGHHMQLSIAQELESVPTFRTQASFTAYVEGWGLYSELLAKEMGAYDDVYADFGRLTTEMWRAVRLVVDTGLHAKGWTEQEAIDFFVANTPEPLESIRSEVRRYIVMPGQATSYKVGMLKILALRAKAEAALGDAFDIRAFHDTVLGGGALPLAVLERRIDTWIDDVKTGA